MENLCDKEIEASIISSLIDKPNIYFSIAIEKRIQEEDFCDELNRKIYKYLLEKWSEGEDISPTIFAYDFPEFEKYKEEIANRYLLKAEYTKQEFKYMIKKLKELSVKRKTKENLEWYLKTIHKEKAENLLEDLLTKAIVLKETLETERYEKIELSNDGIDYANEILDRKERTSLIEGIPTGYSELDITIGGLKKEEVIIIAGRTSMGKSTFALNLFCNIAKQGYKTAFISLEMSKEQILDRIYASETGIPLNYLKKGQLSEEEENKIIEFISRLKEWNAILITRGVETFLDLKTIAYELKNEGKLDILIIDYLQLLKGNRRYNSRQEEVADISRSIKLLAKELEIPIIALAQLSREVEKRGDKRPVLSDLRESGSIEQDADIVIFLYRPEYYLKIHKKSVPDHLKNVAEVIIAKNRQGETKTLYFKFYPEIQKFEEEAEMEDIQKHLNNEEDENTPNLDDLMDFPEGESDLGIEF
jgi:replicative DNA helicase